MREAMANTASTQELTRRIEQLVQEHIAASRTAAREALERAFATAVVASAPTRTPQRARPSRDGKRRTPKEIAALGDRFYQAVCNQPGQTMAVLAVHLDTSARELHRPVSQLKQDGRVRSVGERNHTRYFPMASEASE